MKIDFWNTQGMSFVIDFTHSMFVTGVFFFLMYDVWNFSLIQIVMVVSDLFESLLILSSIIFQS